MNGGRCSSYTDEENQALTERCGILGPIEAQKEFTAYPAPDFFERFDRLIMPEPNSGCWLWLGTALPRRQSALSGYGWFRIAGEYQYAHRASYEATHGIGSASGLDVRHACDNPICVNPDHLSVGTRAENLQDMVRRGRSRRGVKNVHAKLDDAQAIRIIKLAMAGVEQGRIASYFQIDQSAVSYLKTGKRWPHLSEERNPMPKTPKTGMLINDAEIVALVGQDDAIETIAALDADPATRAYKPYWGGRRFRPAVIDKLSSRGAEAKIENVQRLRIEHRSKAS